MIEHTAHLRVRYADTDKMGVVYYGKYFEYFEYARTEMLRACGLPYVMLEELGFGLPVIEASAKYYRGAKYDDLIAVRCTMPLEPSPRLMISYEIRLDGSGELVATGGTTLGFVATSSGKATRPPKIYLDALLEYRKKLEELH